MFALVLDFFWRGRILVPSHPRTDLPLVSSLLRDLSLEAFVLLAALQWPCPQTQLKFAKEEGCLNLKVQQFLKGAWKLNQYGS
jgi:hypothetical protein